MSLMKKETKREKRSGWLILGLFLLVLAIAAPVSAQPPGAPDECNTCPCDASYVDASFTITSNGQTAIFYQGVSPTATGTGLLNPFLRIQGNGNAAIEQGYNTDFRPLQYDETPSWTSALRLSDIPIVEFEGQLYREFRLDINQVNSAPLLSLDTFKVWKMSGTGANLCNNFVPGSEESPGTYTCPAGVTQTFMWNMDTAGYQSGGSPCNEWIKLNYALEPGSGQSDLWALVPLEQIGAECGYNPGDTSCNVFMYFYNLYGETIDQNDGFEEWAVRVVNAKSGVKFHDLDADGVKDAEEPGLGGWTIFLDANANGIFDAGELSTLTSSNAATLGMYQLSGFESANNLNFCEVIPAGSDYVQTYPASGSANTVTHTVGDKTIVCYVESFGRSHSVSVNNNFGNAMPATKTGMKFEDMDADGVKDAEDGPLSGWEICADDGVNTPICDTTDATGVYTLEGLTPGVEYTVTETAQTGWTCSYPDPCQYVITLDSGETDSGNDFGNWYPASKTGIKFEDQMANHVKDGTDGVLSGWEICAIDSDAVTPDICDTTDASGVYLLEGLKPGVTYMVCEVLQANWFQSYPIDTTAGSAACPDGTTRGWQITLSSREADTGNDFGNYQHLYGCTPGFWKNHPASWPTVYDPEDTLCDVGLVPDDYTIAGHNFCDDTLMDALNYGSGMCKGDCLKASILLRVATASLLNSVAFDYPPDHYPTDAAGIIEQVNEILGEAGHDFDKSNWETLKNTMDDWNNRLPCPDCGSPNFCTEWCDDEGPVFNINCDLGDSLDALIAQESRYYISLA